MKQAHEKGKGRETLVVRTRRFLGKAKKLLRRMAVRRGLLPVKKVGFIIVGTQKGGTSALHAYLCKHPELCLSAQKELHFFDNEAVFAERKPDYGRYHAAFDCGAAGQIKGEATPIYLFWRQAARRIWEYNSSMKIVVILRNPIDRAYSHWNMERQKGKDTLPFWEALQSEALRCREALPDQHRVYSYASRGFYVEQLRRFWKYFPREQVLVLRHEELKQDPETVLNKICAFLGVTPFSAVDHKKVHSRAYEASMDHRSRAYLQGVFEEEIRALEEELGWDCREWL